MTQYTPTIPPVNQFSNLDLNALGSQFAALGGHGTSAHLQRIVEYAIYDATPKGYYDDLKILMAGGVKTWKSDEVNYHERVFGRRPLSATAGVAGNVTSQVIPVTSISLDSVTVNQLITYPNNQKATVIIVDKATSSITVQSLVGQLLPAVVANDNFSVQSTVGTDGTNRIDSYSRLETIERFNWIQEFARGTRFGRMEMYKYKNAGTTDYVANNKQEVLDQFRFDKANCYWNGTMGEGILDNGAKAKLMGGVYPIMLASGSPSTTTTLATLDDAVEDIVLSTEFKGVGYTRFLYATPRMLHALCQQYKRLLIRYDGGGNAKLAQLELDAIDMKSSLIVLTPMKRFEELSCFPAAFRDRLILVDNESIVPCMTWADTIVDETPDFATGINQNKYKDFLVDGNLSIEFYNPQGCGIINVQ